MLEIEPINSDFRNKNHIKNGNSSEHLNRSRKKLKLLKISFGFLISEEEYINN